MKPFSERLFFSALSAAGATSATRLPSGAKLNAAINDILKLPEVQEKLKSIGLEPRPGAVADSQAFFRSEIENWGKMVRASGVPIN